MRNKSDSPSFCLLSEKLVNDKKMLCAFRLLSQRTSFRCLMLLLVKATTLAGRVNKWLQAAISSSVPLVRDVTRETRYLFSANRSPPLCRRERERDTDVPSAVQ